jgi:TetR/AcrR family transcriptional regulator, transcriptional repressor for nem operon
MTTATQQTLFQAADLPLEARGTLKPGADPDKLAVSLMAAMQGGYLLASTARDVRPMEISIDAALEHVRAYLAAQ